MRKSVIHVRQLATLLAFLVAGTALAQTAIETRRPPVAGHPASVDPYVHRSNLVVADIDRALTLYRDILGFKVDRALPVAAGSFMYEFFGIPAEAKVRIAFLATPDGRFGAIGMTEVKGVPLPPRGKPYESVLIVEVQKRIEAVHAQALAASPKLEVGKILELTNPARREFPITDYDGHRIIVMQLHAGD
jgi:catechol 2,3-dioxygenase-like lactoylglutathione lyase family enzyme